ncbi:MAG TPA: IS1380 family transposase [Rubrobacter sp.]|nr:IS1380 family transposase [Rubrobacter sp.]
MSRPSRPAAGKLPYDIDPEPLKEVLTARGGLPIVAETFRALGADAAVRQHVHVKERNRGFDEATMVESFVLLLAAGGDCLDDLDILAKDAGLVKLLDHPIPSPEAARQFLYRFHDEEELARRPQTALAWTPTESAPLAGLAVASRAVIGEVGRRRPAQKIATVDMDATIIESRKREAFAHYDGGRGYQPEVAVWAETGLILADEFRDGNVPAGSDPLSVTKRAFASLPPTITERNFRGDSACYNHDLLNWLRDENRKDGPAGKIRFAVSADMSQDLRARIEALSEAEWTLTKRPGGQADPADVNEERSWAEVTFVPNGTTKKGAQPDRYLAIRIRPRQRALLGEREGVRHYAVVTNELEWDGAKLLWWHRAKAGTVEMVHDILKNELGAGVMPCGRFGANAAWFRLNVLTHNLLVALKWLALPPELLDARPKRLRFRFFTVAARVTESARKMVLRVADAVSDVLALGATRSALWDPTPA